MNQQNPQYNLTVENEVLRQHQRVLIDLARYATEAADAGKFFGDVMIRTASALEIDHVKLLRYRPVTGDLFMEAGIGWKAGAVGATSFSTDWASPPGRAFQTGEPVMIADFQEARDFRISTLLREHNIISLLNVPVFAAGAVWGVLEADSSVLYGFTADTRTFMTAVASLIGLVLRRAQAEAAQAQAMIGIAQEVQKREVMLREMQHRVKNNFQTILAMIGLNLSKVPTETGREVLTKIANGIMTMSLAHNQLSPTRSDEVVGLAGYLKALAANTEPSLDKIGIEVKSDDVEVSIEQAVAIGLIVNEAVTNSAKHAFGPEGGTIRIELQAASGQGLATLAVTDNGKGVGERKQEGTGLKLMRSLADQIGGKVERDSSGTGTKVRLVFPMRAG